MNRNNKNAFRKKLSYIVLSLVTLCSVIAVVVLVVTSLNSKDADEETASTSYDNINFDDDTITYEEFLLTWDANDSDLAAANVGDVVNFGRFEQDGDTDNFLEVLSWDVLDKTSDSVMLISHDVIVQQPYHYTVEYVTWEASTLRKWLNEDFLKAAFNENERPKLILKSVENPSSHDFFEPFYGEFGLEVGADGGNDTEDIVYLLSYKEAIEYYQLEPSNEVMGYQSPALFAGVSDATSLKADGCSTWWLRSPGDNPQFAMYVSGDYLQGSCGNIIDNTIGVRPVIWVSLED